MPTVSVYLAEDNYREMMEIREEEDISRALAIHLLFKRRDEEAE